MKNTIIVIPTRLNAKRFPNKPLAKINNIPMILHVLNRAKESKAGEVFIATPDSEIFNLVKKNGGQAIITKDNHLSGTDRVYEVFKKNLKKNIDLIINLQGDMPNIKPSSILNLEKLMRKNNCEIGTLASNIENKSEIKNFNIVKVEVEEDLKNDDFSPAKDFFRLKKDLDTKKIYHHIGIYAFTSAALSKYVELPRSKLEIERNLEQMRAMDNNIKINVALSDTLPLGVDTEEDLKKVAVEM